MKKTITFLTLLFTLNICYSQFSQLKQRPSNEQSNLLHSCIAKSKLSSAFYVLATNVCNGNTNKIAIQKLNTSGVTLWEKELYYSDDDKVLDVVVDKSDNIIIVGYTKKTRKKQLLIAKFNTNGVLIKDFILHSEFSTVGTKIIESKTESSYFIGGFEFEEELSFNMKGHALLMSISKDLLTKRWERFYQGTEINNTITDVVELPNKNLFITGSVGNGQYGQDVLAAIVDPGKKGQIIPNGNFSFTKFIDASLGASAIYNSENDEISLLFNSGIPNRMFVMTISDAATSTPTTTYAGLKMDISLLRGYSGYKLIQSLDDPDNLVIMGYYDFFPQQNTGFGIFAMEFDKLTGVLPASIKLWKPSGNNSGVQFQGGDVLSLFSASTSSNSPYFHTPNISITSHDNEFYVSLTPDKISSFTEVGIIEFDKDLMFATSSCLTALDYTAGVYESEPVSISSEKHFSIYSYPESTEEAVYYTYPTYCQFIFIPHVNRPRSRKSNGSVNENQEESLTKLNCFPNPVMNELTISIPGSNISEIKVFDMIGNLVVQFNYSSVSQSKIDTHDWIKGMYLIQVTSVDGEVSKSKVIKN